MSLKKLQLFYLPLLLVLASTSFTLNAEVFDFESVELTANQPYLDAHSETMVAGNYQLKVEEGVFIRDTYLSNKTDDSLSFHPSKGFQNIPLENTSLVSQRLSLIAADNATLFLCQFNVAEKRQLVNVAPLKIIGYFNENHNGKTIVQTVELIVEPDRVSGYQRIELHESLWERAFNRFDIIVQNEQGAAGQLHFDDLRVESNLDLCL
jgi:hypothetical protein